MVTKLHQHLPGMTKEHHKILGQDNTSMFWEPPNTTQNFQLLDHND
jgi:hypothetical protein